MIRRAAPLGLAGLVVLALLVSARGDGPASDDERVEQLSEQLRCPVCDGLAVADSPSSTARAIAADVRSRVAAGESDEEIRRAYVAQYGEWILLEPPGGGFGALAWGLPIGLVVGAGGAGAWVLRRRGAGDATGTGDGRADEHTPPVARRATLLAWGGIAAAAVVAGSLVSGQLAPRVPPAPPAADEAAGASRVARLATVVQERPDDIPARAALARLLVEEQDLSAAQEQFDAITELDPTHAEALAYAGWLATLAGDVDGGMDRLERAVAADPTYPDARAFHGLALMRAGEDDAAADELRRYLELAPEGPLASQVAAVAARLGGRP